MIHMICVNVDNVISTLKKEGFRITPQRMAILDCILKTSDHPTAERIHKIVRRKYPMVSLSTIYKTLDLLKDRKIVNKIEIGGETRFDAHTDEHINLICMNCSHIEDVDDGSIKEIRQRISRRSQYYIVRGSIELFGYCNKCKSKFK